MPTREETQAPFSPVLSTKKNSPAQVWNRIMTRVKPQTVSSPHQAAIQLKTNPDSLLLGMERDQELEWKWLSMLDKAWQENLPFGLVKLGEGFSDLGHVRLLPKVKIYTPSTGKQVTALQDRLLAPKCPFYLRLPVQPGPEQDVIQEKTGFNLWGKGHDLVIFTSGSGVKTALDLAARLTQREIKTGIIEIWDWTTLSKEDLYLELSSYTYLASLESHAPQGGLGSLLLELLSDFGKSHAILRLGYPSYQDCKLPSLEELEKIFTDKIW